MKIAISGANGHVGVNLCKALVERGHVVSALVHKHAGGLQGLPIQIVRGDILDKNTLTPLIEGSDVVYHLAARISITGDKNGMVSLINTQGTKNMLEVAARCKVARFIHFSSIHAFRQNPYNEPLNESRPLVGAEGFAYDRSKAAGERAVMEAVGNGLDAVVLSPTAIIGQEDFEPSLVGKAVIDICKGKIPSLAPGGYDWVDVRDVVEAAIYACDHGRTGQKYLLSGHWHSLKEFSQMIGLHTGKKTVSVVAPMWLARIGLPFTSLYSKVAGTDPLYTSESLKIISEGNRQISHSKASIELNHHPRPFSDTMRDFLSWLKKTGRI
ncbi:MAG: NAD-dependent epimerase/dehydratase family protein [Bacteroidetes bacterium]|nr:NAD-dependent epimerase/dehydratase family protein [Bacteroidota bacterium]